MKGLYLLLCITICTQCLKSQDTTAILKIAEVMPKYPTGDSGLYQFIRQNIQFPQLCIDSGIQGKVYVRFVVSADGRVKNAEVIKGVCSLLNDEAIRVVNRLPAFVPGKNKGENVDVYYTVPIKFVLPAGENSDLFQVLSTCDVQPQYEGGDNSLFYFLSNTLQPPEDKNGNVIQGRSTVGFLIDTFGKISGVRIVKPAEAKLDSEAVRVVKQLKSFKPALLAGKKVSSYVVLNFNFGYDLQLPDYNGASVHDTRNAYSLKNPATIAGGDEFIYGQLEKSIKVPNSLVETDNGFFSISFTITEKSLYESKESVSEENEKKYWVKKQTLMLLPEILRTATAAKKGDTAIVSYYNVSLAYKVKNGHLAFDRTHAILKSGTDQKIFRFVEKSPEFIGGDAEMIRFLQRNIVYPRLERDNDIQGKVLVRFVIDETGKVNDPQVVSGVSPGLDKEALRIVSLLPPFKPSEQDGEKVKVYFHLPVVFKLQ